MPPESQLQNLLLAPYFKEAHEHRQATWRRTVRVR